MRLRRTVMVLSALLVVPMLMPAPASAGGRHEPFFADFNQDGRQDRAILGRVGTTTTCTVSVETMKPDGTYRAPKTRSFTSPATRLPYCPDMGEAVDLDSDGELEIVTAWFSGTTYADKMLVLRHFKPAGIYQGIGYPSTLRKIDFDGDGREDIWQSSDQSGRLRAFRNDGSGGLVSGPFDACSAAPVPQHVFADFNGDGGQDMLLSRTCFYGGGPVINAEIYFGSGGAQAVLVNSTDSHREYKVFLTDLGADGIPDAGVVEQDFSGTVFATYYFRNDGTGVFTEV
ncbi:FG-GAP repeat domain-containing protein [Actinokineospora xionganensis]|uniref:VCBS repeat-containing protein n=1 Tax=Actinokineospora xionganensis TaxID=2684470 RepID=A0ABR7L8J7_9PSEU|nr:VCBS repeat-containing protein [Actinokineospora xionganensis]MBC6448887.1 VCBS repeat-containing protein [Actinokineospora xionganensis]